MISKKILLDTLDFWERECPNIMDSQKKHNEEALAWSKARFEKWIEDLNVHSV